LRAREELRDGLLGAIRDAARACEHARRWEDAANLYRSGIELDSLNEGLYRGLMLCHCEIGDHSEALQAYRRCRELLTALPRRAAQRQDASPISQRTRARGECAHLGRGEAHTTEKVSSGLTFPFCK